MSGRAKTADGILHVPVMMYIQALTRQDFFRTYEGTEENGD